MKKSVKDVIHDPIINPSYLSSLPLCHSHYYTWMSRLKRWLQRIENVNDNLSNSYYVSATILIEYKHGILFSLEISAKSALDSWQKCLKSVGWLKIKNNNCTGSGNECLLQWHYSADTKPLRGSANEKPQKTGRRIPRKFQWHDCDAKRLAAIGTSCFSRHGD